mgnify:CR=1 FL=1
MAKETINFKQERDFGEVFNATFGFIGQEFKMLGTSILYFGIPLLIVAAIFSVFISLKQQEFMGDFTSNLDPQDSLAQVGEMYKYIFLTLLVMLIAMVPLQCTIYGYIKCYIEKGRGNFTQDDVWQKVKQYFFPFLGTTILVSIVVLIGTVLCILPGIFLAVSLSLIYAVMMFESKGFGQSFSESFNLTMKKWWLTLGILFVAGILIYVIQLILSIPSIILFGFKSFFTAIKEGSTPVFPTGYYIMSAAISLITYVLYSIPAIILAFHYFSLKETFAKPSLEDKIEQIQ